MQTTIFPAKSSTTLSVAHEANVPSAKSIAADVAVLSAFLT